MQKTSLHNHPAYLTRPPHQVLPEDIDCVLGPSHGQGAIFIGNLEAAENLQTLKKHNIASLLTACKNIHIRHPKQHVPYTLYIPGEDHQEYDLSLHFDTAADFIHQSRKETNILVHCMAGISRSVTLVLAYMMKYMGLSLEQAFSQISSKRRKINPNPGFVRQLQNFQKTLAISNSRREFSSIENQVPSRYQESSKYSSTNFNSHQKNYRSFFLTNKANLENAQQYNPESEAPSFSKYFQPTRNIRPQYPQTASKPFQESRAYRLAQPSSTQSSFSLNYDFSIEALSKDLEERINKIKQKYYEKGGYDQTRMKESGAGERRSIDIVDRMPSFKVDERERRVTRESLGSIYNGYRGCRPMSYNYSYLGSYQ